jgi:Raf kinase inhibitor-like YbhB/YbcL family protein
MPKSTMKPPSLEAPMTMQLSSPAFAAGEVIPQKYTCDGNNISPPLEWNGVPENARSLVLIVDDPDAPRGTWSHWVVANIDPSTTSLPEGGPLPQQAREGRNDFRKHGYGGPCPPPGSAHRYFFHLYALDNALDVADDAGRADVLDAMQDHILAQGELMVTFQR